MVRFGLSSSTPRDQCGREQRVSHRNAMHGSRSTGALPGRSGANQRTLQPLSATHFGTGAAWGRASSPLKRYPHAASAAAQDALHLADLRKRTFSSVSEAEAASRVDRIGRNYTLTAQGLTLAKLRDLLSRRVAPLPAPGRASPAPTRRRRASQGRALAASSSTGTLGVSPVPHRSGGFLSRSTGSKPEPKPRSLVWEFEVEGEETLGGGGKSHTTAPAADAVSAATQDGNVYASLTPRTRDAVHEEAISAYWRVVDSVISSEGLAPWNPVWEAGILDRLGITEGPRRTWLTEEGEEVRPTSHLSPLQSLSMGSLAGPGTFDPARMVENMMEEAEAQYFTAVKRAMLEYALLSPDPSAHFGLHLYTIEATRFVPRPPVTRGDCGVALGAVPLRALAFATRTHCGERIMGQLWNLLWKPDAGYRAVRLVDVAGPSFAGALPLALPQLVRRVEASVEQGMDVLSEGWRRDATELLAGFIIDMQVSEGSAGSEDPTRDPLATDVLACLAAYDYARSLEHPPAQLGYGLGLPESLSTRGSQTLSRSGVVADLGGRPGRLPPLQAAANTSTSTDSLLHSSAATRERESRLSWDEGDDSGEAVEVIEGADLDAATGEVTRVVFPKAKQGGGGSAGVHPARLCALVSSRGASILDRMWPLQGKAAVARRLKGVFASGATLLSKQLHELVMSGVAEFEQLLSRYETDEAIVCGEGGQPAAAFASPTQARVLPCLRLSLEVDLGRDAATGAPPSERSRNLEELNISADSIEDVDITGKPVLGRAVQSLWVGSVSIVFSPSPETVVDTLQGTLSHLLTAAQGIPRPEVEIEGDGSDGEDDDVATSPSGPHSSRTLSAVATDDERVLAVKEQIKRVVHAHMVGPRSLRSRFDKFRGLFEQTKQAELLAIAQADPRSALKLVQEAIQELDATIADIEGLCGDIVDFGFFSLSTVQAKEVLVARVRLLSTSLLHQIKTNALAAIQAMNARYAFLSSTLLTQPTDSGELVRLSEFAARVFDDLAVMQKATYSANGVSACLRFLHSEGLVRELRRSTPGAGAAMGAAAGLPASSASEDRTGAANRQASRGRRRGGVKALPHIPSIVFAHSEALAVRDLLSWPEQVKEDLEACRLTLDKEKEGLVAQVAGQAAEFERRLESAAAQVDRLSAEGSMIHVVELNSRIADLGKALQVAMDEAANLAVQQERLQLPVVEYPTRIRELSDALGPFERLWKSVSEYLDARQVWYSKSLSDIDTSAAERTAETLKLAAIRVAKELPEDAEGPIAVARKMRGEVEVFLTRHAPLMALLANPGLKPRHWDDMEAIVGMTLPRDSASPLEAFLRLGLDSHVGAIEETCVNASKEHNLERALERMMDDWVPVKLDLKPHKDTGTYILSSATADELQLLLDDHIIKATTMQASRFARPLEARIKKWISSLNRVQAVLDEWLKVQSSWLYLEPIFSSDDIMRQMPSEAEHFATVNATWRTTMKGAVADPRALHVMEQAGLLEKLQEANALLDAISKGLNAYLETKRLFFPRFFFLSNDELLEILAETKDPLRVQRHMKKCFEGIAALDFADNLDILGMESPEGEVVALSPQLGGGFINPQAAGGAVEVWLLQVEEAMRRSVARCMDDAIKAYKTADRRSSWAISWSAQSVLGASQMWWTQEVEAAIHAGGAAKVKEYARQCTEQLQDIIMLVRGKLEKLQRKVLSTLMVLDVHSRDVTVALAEKGVSSPYDFEWSSQLRYYWADDGVSAKTGRPHSMCMRMINAEMKYAGEYLGAAGRLVITPLTDRCYRTLIGALYLDLGGAPEGPAGTGKTETVKDLAKSAGMMCVVYNCSDQLDAAAMAKFFKGLAASGAWACFDEFNRIQLEVLSVIAQQILTIQLAKRAGKDMFVFEGTELKLTRTANCFITMNPGYAGRAELPDNLKALFRSVAMMVPDYAMIATIILYSNGYLEAEPMARKIVTTYKLCSEQLSSQDHYDYGMRAVMAVLRAAANLKRVEGHLPEAELVLRSIVDVNLPKFLAHDIPLFNGIVSDLFPSVEVTPPDRQALTQAIVDACRGMGLQPHAYLLEKVLQVYEMMIVRHGFMLVGMPWSGKSTGVKVLSRAMELLSQRQHDEGWQRIVPVVLFPKAVTMGQLYGENDEVTQEWRDGVLSRHFRQCAEGKIGAAGDRTWVLFDGPVDAIWIENMNTVLDDNKKLCLMSGEIVAMSDTMSMVFETKDLASASPATVSRCGMVYLEPVSVGWRPLLSSWLQHFAEDNPSFPFKAARKWDAAAVEREGQAALAGTHEPGLLEDSRPFTLHTDDACTIQRVLELLVDPLLTFLRKADIQEYVPTQDMSLVSSVLAVLECLLALNESALSKSRAAQGKGKAPSATAGVYTVGGMEVSAQERLEPRDWEALVLFSMVWGMASSVRSSAREKVEAFVTQIVSDPGSVEAHPLFTFIQLRGWSRGAAGVEHGSLEGAWPSACPLYDSWYDLGSHKWRSWSAALPEYDIAPDAAFADIIVPTKASVQFEHMVSLLVTHRKQALVVGPTGTGKSAYMRRLLLKGLPADAYQPVFVSFSARTSAAATQAIVDEKAERRRKGVYGPRPGVTATVFVDDLNLPEPEVYGAQPPLELLRQLVDQGGWYDMVELSFRQFEDTMLLAAMAPPDGGRNHISPRVTRHFNILAWPDFDDSTLADIFSTILGWHFATPGWSAEVAGLVSAVVSATKTVFSHAVKTLRPTPAKSHYTFNLRDFSRVVQGVAMATPRTVPDSKALARLWTHEACRVFGDRLVDGADRAWFATEVNSVVREAFGHRLGSITPHFGDMKVALAASSQQDAHQTETEQLNAEDLRLLLWGQYATAKGEYGEASDATELVAGLEECLTEYNATSKSKMDLVMFLFFIEHVSRVARVLAMPGGHALLVGVGGSGRQCAARLACSMASARLEVVELTKSYSEEEWRDDLKRVLMEAGTGQGDVVFFFSDTQIKWPGMVEDLSNILNAGEVPNLFGAEDRPEILEKTATLARQAGMGRDLAPGELWALFVSRCKMQLHVVLAMSPIGSAFRERLRKFPSLVNCCTVDWFTAWPEDALSAVAVKHLKDLSIVQAAEGCDVTEQSRKSALLLTLTQLCQTFHRSARAASERFGEELKRYVYVTPTSYMELLSQFVKSLGATQAKVAKARDRYLAGLTQLEVATQSVNELRTQLEALQPTLVQSQADTAAIMVDIEAKLPGVEETRAVVNKEAEAANADAAIVQGQKDECEADLAEAIPVLESALAALNTLTKKDFDTIRAYQKPPGKVKLALEAVCVMLAEKPDRIKDPEGGTKKVDDYWAPAKRLLGDVKSFMSRLRDYDKDSIPPAIMSTLRSKYIPNPDFDPAIVKSASEAAAGLASWCHAMDKYDRVAKVVAPKRAALAEAEAQLSVKMAALEKQQARLAAVEADLAELQGAFEAADTRKADLEREVELTKLKLLRAEQLISGLGGEKARWTDAASDLQRSYDALTGDVLVSSGIISYLGAFNIEFRRQVVLGWVSHVSDAGLSVSATPGVLPQGATEFVYPEDDGTGPGIEEFSLSSVLGDAITIRDWQLQGLPTDSFSADNAVIVANARRWPLLIDPQGQANKWVKNMERGRSLRVVKLTDSGFLRTLENAIQLGLPVCLENVGEELDPALEPILLRQVFKVGGTEYIRLGDANVEYDSGFSLFITTKLRNPHYLPEVSTKVTLLNFMITPAGLQDQLLGTVVEQERPDLAAEKARLLVEGAENTRSLAELEDRILEVLSREGNILEDETAISVLNESKELSNDIMQKQAVAAKTEAAIDETRAGYVPVAAHASRLFFCISDMGSVDPMYQYSMNWFSGLFLSSIAGSKRSDNLATRISNLNDHFTFSLYTNICRSLFERHKLLFSFLLTVRIMQGRGDVDPAEWFFLLTGGVAVGQNEFPNPAPQWLPEKSWGELCRLSELSTFRGLRADVESDPDAWRRLYDSEMPHQADLPGRWGQLGFLTRLQKIIVLRCIRPDKVLVAVQEFVGASMGERFLTPPPFDLAASHADSSASQPLIFVLSPGSDPMAELLAYAATVGVSVEPISLGQGQGPKAEALIAQARKVGSWVVLQNCHLAVSWMPRLERICEDLADAASGAGEAAAAGQLPPHPKFRLWTTSYPSADFPLSMLQNGVKMTLEPPAGLRNNLRRSYLSDPISNPEFFNGVKNGQAFRRMLFGLAFFHALVQERREFGPLGWNIPYEFNESDLRISVQQLAIFLDDPNYTRATPGQPVGPEAIPYAALTYLTGQCNYGGRVTDDKDRRALMSLLKVAYCPEVHTPGHALDPTGSWCTPGPDVASHEEYLAFIDTLPGVAQPAAFGLHSNANLSKDQRETTALFDDVLVTERGKGGTGGAGSGASGQRREDMVAGVAADILSKLRLEYDLEAVAAKFPVDWAESMNTVLTQELARFNRLLSLVHSSLAAVQKAMAGLVLMSGALEELSDDLFFGRVPAMWRARSYPSLKPLGGFVTDLAARLDFFDAWFASGTPCKFWISGFFFTQSFLTGALQNFARKYTVAIDEVEFNVDMLKQDQQGINQPPVDGVYVHGMFLDGARWDKAGGVLAESTPKVLFSSAPVMWLQPAHQSDLKEYQHYACPMYVTSERRGVLRTTGHSSNFVMVVKVPSRHDQHHWIRRGVALLLQLND